MPTPSSSSDRPAPALHTERVAYWYLRLNGFLTIENFLLHRWRGGSNETDADIVGVRFPYRQEALLDDRQGPMQDDPALEPSDSLIDFVIVEVKTGRCALNGPWTESSRQNIDRVLHAIGIVETARVNTVSDSVYATGHCVVGTRIRLRLLAIGSAPCTMLERDYPTVTQVTWAHVLAFIHSRFQRYRDQKTDVQQWADDGQMLRNLASRTRDREKFIRKACASMGVVYPPGLTPTILGAAIP